MSNKKIFIPAGIKYLTELKNEHGTPFELPNGILNKGLTGCGGTTLALTDKYPTIITSPRKKLMENKKEQIGDDLLIVDANVFDHDIEEYLDNHKGVPKIMVTYDSFYRVKRCIGKEIDKWRVVLDEFHCLQIDASFKSETIISFMHEIEDLPYVTYLSATPIHPEYLKKIPELCNKPIYTLEWEKKPEMFIARCVYHNPVVVVQNIIKQYKDGYRFSQKDENGNVVKCNELVFFVNSVSVIINIIENMGLSNEEVTIIISETEENEKFVKKLGENFTIGSIPLKGQPHKMFTFCTSTAYFGVDMYSKSACSIVVSDIHKENTSVDISSELLQIVGRQRNPENPFRNKIMLIYNTTGANVNNMNDMIDCRMKKSEYDLQYYQNLSGKELELGKQNLIDLQDVNKFKFSYVYYDAYLHDFALNKIKYLADLLRCSAQNEVYKNVKYIDQLLQENGFTLSGETKQWEDNASFVRSLTYSSFSDKLKAYCEAKKSESSLVRSSAIRIAGKKYEKLFPLYYSLGVEKLEELHYDESKIKFEWNITKFHDKILAKVNETFTVGSVWTVPEIKNKYMEILIELNLGHKTMPKTKIAERYGIDFGETSGGFDVKGKSITVHKVVKQHMATAKVA